MTPQVIPSGSVNLNRQTGYFEQAAQVVNLRSDALADVLLIVTGLTNDTRGVPVSWPVRWARWALRPILRCLWGRWMRSPSAG